MTFRGFSQRHPRSEEIKEKIGLSLIEILNESFLPTLKRLGLDCNPTVEIRTLQNYFISNVMSSQNFDSKTH